MTKAKIVYPAARRCDHVDNYHGTEVADPYRWLEDPDSEETRAFVDAQNKVTEGVLAAAAETRGKFHALLKENLDYEKRGTVWRSGDNYFYYYNPGLLNQSVLYVCRGALDADPEVLIDPNPWSDDGTVTLGSFVPDEQCTYAAYSVVSSGSDWRTVRVMRVSDGTVLEDELEWVKFSCLSWTHDGLGFFYNRYDRPADVEDAGTETDSAKFQKLFYHRVGTPQADDVLAYDFPDHEDYLGGAQVSSCGGYVVVTVSESCLPVNKLYVCRTPEDGVRARLPLRKVIDNFDAEYEYVHNEGSHFVFKTNKAAPRYRVVRMDIDDPAEDKWEVLLPEAPDGSSTLEWCSLAHRQYLVACHLKDVKHVVALHALADGRRLCDVPVPVGCVMGATMQHDQHEVFLNTSGFTQPGTVHRLDLAANPPSADGAPARLTVHSATQFKGIDLDSFDVSQQWVTSRDGVKFPVFIIHHKDVQLDGQNPCLLYGYGGFNISLTPCFSVSRLLFMHHMRGVMVVANIRGGGEYGRQWHQGGSQKNKQNCMTDFQCAAEYLIEHKYTSSERLAIQGGSNGGLLVGACANQRPDLFSCVVAQVGVMDLLRFHKFTIGAMWVSDYCSSDSAEDFPWLLKLSPVHNVRRVEGAQYPAMLIMTADHDDRVVPLHSLKLVAALQHELGRPDDDQQQNPLVARIEVKAGHGSGKPLSKIIDESADVYAFIYLHTNAKWYN